MADDANYLRGEVEKFHTYHKQLMFIKNGDSEEYKTEINAVLDHLNSLDYSLKLAKDEEVCVLLLHGCCIVSLKYELLVVKFCQTIVNLVARQQVCLSQNVLVRVIEYLLSTLKRCSSWMIGDVLHSLGAVLYENGGRVSKFYEDLLGRHGVLIQLTEGDEDHERAALQCIENMCMRSVDEQLDIDYVTICFQHFLNTLHRSRSTKTDPLVHSRIIIACVRGIQNVLSLTKDVHQKYIGELLAALKMYTMFGLPGQTLNVPPCLYPTPMSQYDPNPPTTTIKTRDEETPKATVKKSRKKKATTPKQKQGGEDGDTQLNVSMGNVSISKEGPNFGDKAEKQGLQATDSVLFRPLWKVTSSESEYSDTEGGQASRLRAVVAKVRHSALGCLHAVLKNTDKKVVFGFWSHFIPDTTGSASSQQTHTLFTIILKDPTPKVRTAALAVLAALVEGSKQYLAAADDSEQHRATFTSFSATLGTMVKELHRCLLLALASENSPLTVTQIIKCIGIVIPNVPYHKLKPGLLNRIVKQIKSFLSHRDPNVRVACLTCLGAIVGVQAPLLEVCHILQPGKSQTQTSLQPDTVTPENGTPDSASGSNTPSLADLQNMPPPNTEVSWVIKLCVKNITSDSKLDRSLNASFSGRLAPYEPLPIKLESLQVLANLTKGYFPFVKSCLLFMSDVIMGCLEDKDPSVQLHGAKLLEVLGSTMLQKTSDNLATSQPHVSVSQAKEFWVRILNGPLPATLQNQTQPALRATACDCISNIGPHVFKELEVGKRMMCITLVLGLAGDDDSHVKAAAIRALGVYVLYPCLREDVSFVADAANSVITCMEDKNLGVRMKAAWSLGNLSDALVMNKDESDQMFVEDFSDMLLLKVFSVATKASQDNDKVKSNAVRSLGNLLRYAHPRFLGKGNVKESIDQAIHALVRTVASGTMKVRWNACYAIGNVFKNKLLPIGTASWTDAIMGALCSVVQDCKNFKVRINAAMALAVPESREHYGSVALYTLLWSSLLTAVDNAQRLTDFSEFKYRDNLIDQICSTLVHCIGLLSPDDMTQLYPLLQTKEDLISTLITKYCQTEQKEEREAILKERMCRLEMFGKLDKVQQACLFLFLRVLKPKITDTETKTSFLSTYD